MIILTNCFNIPEKFTFPKMTFIADMEKRQRNVNSKFLLIFVQWKNKIGANKITMKWYRYISIIPNCHTNADKKRGESIKHK